MQPICGPFELTFKQGKFREWKGAPIAQSIGPVKSVQTSADRTTFGLDAAQVCMWSACLFDAVVAG